MAAAGIVSAVLTLICMLPLILAAVFAVEVIMAAIPGSHAAADGGHTASASVDPADELLEPNLAVLIPAHNEQDSIGGTVAAIAAGLSPDGRILVVADNCDDETATRARGAGAEVVERNDPARRGKGFALEFGIRTLEQSPPDVVVVMDADCRAEPGALSLIAHLAAATGRPVQARYDMLLPPDAKASNRGLRVAAFAWRVKTLVRPLGLARMGLPCPLMGTGMAFPFALARKAHIGTDEIVEDLVLGLELTRDGAPPLFAPEAGVSSMFPANEEGQKSQRTRWETGHVQTILRRLPKMIATGMAHRNTPLLALCADTAVPPLAFLALILAATTALAGAAWLSVGAVAPLLICLAAIAQFTLSVGIAWRTAGKDLLSARDLSLIPCYVIGKFSLYARILLGQRPDWVRTRRD